MPGFEPQIIQKQSIYYTNYNFPVPSIYGVGYQIYSILSKILPNNGRVSVL